jgi:ATP adenylyltransferase
MNDPILWTPWRLPYILGQEGRDYDGCLFCVKGRGDPEDAAFDAREYVVARSTAVYVALNVFPYSSGHLLIVPYDHVASPEDLSPPALTDLMLTTNRALAALRACHRPDAFNVGANLGASAGAGIPEHFHLHVVPRWHGDTAFISVIGGTRTIPELLETTYRQLREEWDA